MRPLARILLAAFAALAACEQRPKPAPPSASQPPQRAAVLTMRDLALATAVDAKAARLSAIGADVEAALAAAGPRGRARAPLRALEVARAELEQAVAAVASPVDRPLAQALLARALRYAQELAGAASAGGGPGGVVAARAALGDAIGAYRQSRTAWRLDAPEPRGAEREFAEARREMERAETAAMAPARVAPREGRRDGGPAGLRIGGAVAVDRARAAAGRLPPSLRDPALRYAAAQERVLAAIDALARAPEPRRPAAARAYHLAKADALAALADYFAAAAAR